MIAGLSTTPRRIAVAILALVIVLGLAAALTGNWLADGAGGRGIDKASYRDAWQRLRCAPPFSASEPPGACWRPYGAQSPFNQRLPANPRLAPGSAVAVARLTAAGGPSDPLLGTAGTDQDWQHPVYWARRSDPVFTVHCLRAQWGRCEIEGVRIRIPDAARPAAGGDGHMAVIDPRRRWEYDLWQVRSKPKGGGVITATWGGSTRFGPRGDGLGSDATAAHFGLLAGIIRPAELQAGRIRHALVVHIRCDSGSYVYPARGTGSPCRAPAGAPPEGARFQLAMSEADIKRLRAPRWKRAILRAMARYGFFVEDTGGSPWDVALESGASFTSFGLPDPWTIFAQRAGLAQDAEGIYHLPLSSGVPWASRLRMIDPCVSQRDCE